MQLIPDTMVAPTYSGTFVVASAGAVIGSASVLDFAMPAMAPAISGSYARIDVPGIVDGWTPSGETWVFAPTTTNNAKNPSFEANITDDWSFGQSGGSGSANWDGAQFFIGTHSCRIRAGTAAAWIINTGVSVPNGKPISIQCRIRASADPTGAKAYIQIWDVTNGIGRAAGIASVASLGAWEYVSATWTNNTGLAATCQLQGVNNFNNMIADVWFDAMQLELGPVTPYCDGSLGFGHIWTGAAHNSNSQRTQSMFVVPSYVQVKYQKGTKIKLTDGTVKYFYVANPFWIPPNTHLVLQGGTDFGLSGTITSPFYSYVEAPQAFPGWMNFDPSPIVGYSTPPSGTVYRFSLRGTTCYLEMIETANGVGNSGNRNYTLPIPRSPLNNLRAVGITIGYVDNNVDGYLGVLYIYPTVIAAFKANGAAFGGAGNSRAFGNSSDFCGCYISYEI